MPAEERNRHTIREGDLLEARLQTDIKNGKVMPSIFDLAKDYDNLNTMREYSLLKDNKDSHGIEAKSFAATKDGQSLGETNRDTGQSKM